VERAALVASASYAASKLAWFTRAGLLKHFRM
jgi:hypothetical protein